MKIIPVGYGNPKHRPLIEQLMQDESTSLVDVRLSPRSAVPGWHRTSLERRYGVQFRWLPSLGNVVIYRDCWRFCVIKCGAIGLRSAISRSASSIKWRGILSHLFWRNFRERKDQFFSRKMARIHRRSLLKRHGFVSYKMAHIS